MSSAFFTPNDQGVYVGLTQGACCCTAEEASELAAFPPGFLLSEATSGLQYDTAVQDVNRDAHDPANIAFWKELREALEPMTPPRKDRPMPPKLQPGIRQVAAKCLEEERLFADIAQMVKSDIGSEEAGLRTPRGLGTPRGPPNPRGLQTPRERLAERFPQTQRRHRTAPTSIQAAQTPDEDEEEDLQESVLHEVAAQLFAHKGGLVSWIKDREQELGTARRGLPTLREQEPEVCPETAREPEVSPEGDEYVVPESDDDSVERPLVPDIAEGKAPAQQSGMWVVVGTRLPVRRSRSVLADSMGEKQPGEVVRGNRDGQWLTLEGGAGFCLISDGSTVFLKSKSSL